jgi:hypothetical protein
MPPICYHLGVARNAAQVFPDDYIGEYLGAFLFGSTLPDCHIIAGISRAETHFVDLPRFSSESGRERFLRVYPQFRNRENTRIDLRALIAGCLAHLVTDEMWVDDIYRPYFGNCSPLADDPMSSIMDRALQYEMDRGERLNKTLMADIRRLIRQWSPNENNTVNFIKLPEIIKWQEFICLLTEREPSWDRFNSHVHRFLFPGNKVSPEQLQTFLDSLPGGLQKTIDYISVQKLEAFRRKAVHAARKIMEEYLI